MLIPTILAAALLNTMNFQQLETLYWDCDALFMKGDMGGQDMMSCLAVTDEFQARFFVDNSEFKRYWQREKTEQWKNRGYKEPRQGTDS
jgi:hypothetical protein